MGSPFDSAQLLWVSSKNISSVISEILENVTVFARRRRRRRQGYDNISMFSSKTAELKCLNSATSKYGKAWKWEINLFIIMQLLLYYLFHFSISFN